MSFTSESIDFGAHPNERALSQVLKLSKGEGERRLDVNYLSGYTTGMELCLTSTAQVGVFALKTFQHVFRERYDLLGLSARLTTLQTGL